MIREQPPTALISSGERRIINPHVPGTLYHQNFCTLVEFYRHLTKEALERHHDEFHRRSENFLAYSVKQMSDFEFQAGVIRAVYLYFFNEELRSSTVAA
jgi:hypothetical protein